MGSVPVIGRRENDMMIIYCRENGNHIRSLDRPAKTDGRGVEKYHIILIQRVRPAGCWKLHLHADKQVCSTSQSCVLTAVVSKLSEYS